MAFLIFNRRDGRSFCADEHQTNQQSEKVSGYLVYHGKTFDGVAEEKSRVHKKIADYFSQRRLGGD